MRIKPLGKSSQIIFVLHNFSVLLNSQFKSFEGKKTSIRTDKYLWHDLAEYPDERQVTFAARLIF